MDCAKPLKERVQNEKKPGLNPKENWHLSIGPRRQSQPEIKKEQLERQVGTPERGLSQKQGHGEGDGQSPT